MQGFLLSVKTMPLIQLANPIIKMPIYRGSDLFGSLEVHTTFDVDVQRPAIDYVFTADASATKRPNYPRSYYSTISGLDNALYYEKIVMGYFPYKAPTVAEVRGICVYSRPIVELPVGCMCL
jgi:hypothetical protein